MAINPKTSGKPSAPNTLNPDTAGSVGNPNSLSSQAEGSVGNPNTLTADAAGTVVAPNTPTSQSEGVVVAPNALSSQSAATIGNPNSLSADAAGTVVAPNSLSSQTAGSAGNPNALTSLAGSFPRTLIPLVNMDFAADNYTQNGNPVTFGDLFTYSRSSSATFINRRVVNNKSEYFLDTDYVGSVTNLLTYSEQFDNADWFKVNSSIIKNVAPSPLGDISADKIIDDATNGQHDASELVSFTSGNTYTFSCYFKKAELSTVSLVLNAASFTGGRRVTFDINSGVILGSTGIGSIINAGNGWYLCSITGTADSTSDSRADVELYSGSTSYVGLGGGLYIWGAQITQSAKPLPYVKTISTSASQTFTETLRNEYDPVTGEKLGALIEGGSTNLVLHSEEFDDAVWTKTSSTIVPNDAEAPNGTTSADLIYPDSSGSNRQVFRLITGVSIGTYSNSFYVKSAGLRWIMLPAAEAGKGVWFDVISGVIGTETAGTSGTIKNIGKGWFKCAITSDTTTTNAYSYLRMCDSDGVSSVTANGTDGFHIFGAQLENQPFATSYIRTEASSVTRARDNLEIQSAGNYPKDGSKYTGSVKYDISGSGVDMYLFGLQTDSGGSFIYYRGASDDYLRYRNGGTAKTNTTSTVLTNTMSSATMVYDPDIQLTSIYVNGGLEATQAETGVSVTTSGGNLNVGMNEANSQNLYGHIKSLSIYDAALTAQEVALL